MRFNDNEYDTYDEAINDGGEGIFITKEALEKWQNHYIEMVIGHKNEPLKWAFFAGKANALVDILKHFDEMEV